MVKPVAGYRPLAYSSPEAVQTTGTVAWFQRKVRLGDSQVGLSHGVDYIGEPGLPIEVIEFGAAERGIENGGVLAPLRISGEGLPVGLQIIGPEGDDPTTIEFARLLAAEIGRFVPPPAYS